MVPLRFTGKNGGRQEGVKGFFSRLLLIPRQKERMTRKENGARWEYYVNRGRVYEERSEADTK